MTVIFESILHMSGVASIVILTVIVLRFCLKSAPKKFSYILWAVVLLRLLCPVMPESALSTMPRNNGAVEMLEDWEDDYVGEVVTYHDNLPEYDTALDAGVEPIYTPEGGSYVNVAPDGVSPAPTVKTEWVPILAIVWLCGIAAMAAWAVLDYLRLRLRLRTAIREEEGVYTTDEVDSPFVLGLVRPKIYLPSALGESEREYILLHERCHIRRGDHWIKLLAFAALAIHWFNPLVWLAFVLSSRDMEMSCDEAVIKSLGGEVRADYSASLLALATGRRRVSVTPLAFGEGDPKGRIRNLANWKKPTIWIIIVSVVVCIVAAVCLLTDPVSPKAQINIYGSIYTQSGREQKLPGAPGVIYLGELKSVLHESSEPPAEWFQATNLDPKYAGQDLMLPDNRTLYLYDEEGFYLVFRLNEDSETPKIPDNPRTELARGDFDRDGREDRIELSREYSDRGAYRIRLVDVETETVLWSENVSETDQKAIIHRIGEDGLDYIIIDSYDPAEEKVFSREIYISGGREKVVHRSESELTLPEAESDEEFALYVSSSLPKNSIVLFSTLGGHVLTGPIESSLGTNFEPVEVFSGDFDHDGEDEVAVVEQHPLYSDIWNLKLMNPDGSIAWSEEDFATAHMGWKCILAYEGEDGLDYLIRYDPAMFQGIAHYRCEEFYIRNGEEVKVQEWGVEFVSSYNPLMEITAEMAEFAAAVNDLAPRCTLLFSTLDGEVLTGPVNAVDSGVMTVDYLLDHCRSLVQQVGWSDYYSFVSDQFFGGELGPQPEYPAISAWVCGDDWLYISESVAADGSVTRQTIVQKDGREYIRFSSPDGERVVERDPEGYDKYFSWLKNGGLGTNLSFESEIRGGDGLTLNYVELFETEAGTVGSGTHSYVLDEKGQLKSYSLMSSGVVRTITFPRISEAMCRGIIEEAWEEIVHASAYEEEVDPDVLEKYGELIDAVMKGYLKEYSGNPMRFKSAELTKLVYLGGYDHADGSRVDIYDFRFALIPTVIDSNAVAGGAYLDSQNRFQGFGPTHLAVKHKDGEIAGYAVLSDSYFTYSGGEVDAEKQSIIEQNLQSAAPNGMLADTIIDDGSSYPLAVPYGKTVLADLDGDGVKEQVRQTVNEGKYRIESFTINGVEYIDGVREKCGPFENTKADYYDCWYITDILSDDGLLEITVYDDGPSGDPETHFYRYDGENIVWTGTVLSPAAGLKYDGKGYITGSARLAVFQTWFAEHTWSIFGSGYMIQPEPRDFYEVDFSFRDYTIGMDYFPSSDTNPLLQEIVAYKSADKASASWTLPKGTQIGLLGTDNREWLLATADGEECWLHFEGTSLDAPGGLMRDASKVLKGLHYYD